MSNSNWGTNNDAGATQTQKNIKNYLESKENPQCINEYHQTYAQTLEGLGNLIIFGVPLIPAGLMGILLYNIIQQISIFIAICVYGILAFVLWIIISYFIKLFDNISKMAMNTEIMITLMKDGMKNV